MRWAARAALQPPRRTALPLRSSLHSPARSRSSSAPSGRRISRLRSPICATVHGERCIFRALSPGGHSARSMRAPGGSVGGPSTGRPLEFSLDDLKQRFERVTLPAINQCSGNRRGLFIPRVPGVQWGNGAMGNAAWGGVRLRDVLRPLRSAGERARGRARRRRRSGACRRPPTFRRACRVERALDENTLIAFEMNGRPLPHFNGAPARLIVPGLDRDLLGEASHRHPRSALSLRWLLDEGRLPHPDRRLPRRALQEPGDR